MFPCIKEFYEFVSCCKHLRGTSVCSSVVSGRGFWFTDTAVLQVAPPHSVGENIAFLSRLGKRYVLILHVRDRALYAKVANDVIKGAKEYLGVELPLEIDAIPHEYEEGRFYCILKTPDDTYLFIDVPHPLPVYSTDKLTVMVFGVRAQVLSKEEEEMTTALFNAIDEFELLRDELRNRDIEVPKEMVHKVEDIKTMISIYGIHPKVVELRYSVTKEWLMEWVKKSLNELRNNIIAKLKQELVKSELLG